MICQVQSSCSDFPLRNVSLQALKMDTASEFPSTDHVAYDTIERTVTIFEQETVTCSDNIAYASVKNREEGMRNTNISHKAVYEEVPVKD